MSTKHTPGPWQVATSNSWRRIVTVNRMQSVCEPINQADGHPDLFFRNGGANGPDARLIAAAPEMLEALRVVERVLGTYTKEAQKECDLNRIHVAIAVATEGAKS